MTQELKCKIKLGKLLEKKHIYFVKRGNIAIKEVLKHVKFHSSKLLIQDQGGWMTYEPIGNKLGFEVIKLKTNNGLVETINHKNVILLINSLAGYHSLNNMKNLVEQCKRNNILLINDISGSIGLNEAKYGDYLILSSNKDKPLNYERVGIIASDKLLSLEETNIDVEKFYEKLKNFQSRLAFLQNEKRKAKKQFTTFKIIEKKGINFIILYDTHNEKEQIIKICEKNKYEYTECPRYIRLMKKGISVEIKRLR